MRYFVTGPVEGGYSYWDVRDSKSETPNFSVATFWKGLPIAEHQARNLCAILNRQ